jgi:Ca2+-transporting ATPase
MLEFVGLLGLEDPLRPTVPAAVAQCRTAGMTEVTTCLGSPLGFVR